MNTREKFLFAGALTLVGLGGIYLSIPYAGWVLAVGLFCCVGAINND